ncbi:hypothetical protein MY04_4595 [Flammeovirga sp. MY04]|uniref:hypothetical protein n=1 Tax=Flammeovirga sp. MY04 TaxID=1191459 RepID=UPI000806283D|nr:hypothetical protein [Flammeovirga sp. MY04]ANQ51930.1 hypothetical protein MY04_4595 [Flammeovirga sp. MY04]
MIIETTHGKHLSTAAEEKLVGKNHPLLRVLFSRMRSNPYQIIATNLPISFDAEIRSQLDFARVILKTKGIIVRIKIKVKTYDWFIPFYHLALYQTENNLTIHAQGFFLRFYELNDDHYRFWKKMMSCKNEVLN